MIRTVLSVEGMSCGMCEAHVNDAVRSACRVRKVTSSHRTGETVILSEEALREEDLRRALAGTGYTLRAIRTEGTPDRPRVSLLSRLRHS